VSQRAARPLGRSLRPNGSQHRNSAHPRQVSGGGAKHREVGVVVLARAAGRVRTIGDRAPAGHRAQLAGRSFASRPSRGVSAAPRSVRSVAELKAERRGLNLIASFSSPSCSGRPLLASAPARSPREGVAQKLRTISGSPSLSGGTRH